MSLMLSGADEKGKENEAAAVRFRSVVAQLAENTAMHGLPNMHKAKSKEKKTFWIAVLIFGVCKYLCNTTHTEAVFLHVKWVSSVEFCT